MACRGDDGQRRRWLTLSVAWPSCLCSVPVSVESSRPHPHAVETTTLLKLTSQRKAVIT